MPAAKIAASSVSNPFIKQLASSDRSIRDRALSSLRTYLHRSTPFTELDLLKLWKGLHYCMFMSDKPRNQQRLARDLAALTDVLAPANVLPWFAAFWKTIAREWGSIDSLRMDKYLYLIRCYVDKGFEVCAKKKWDEDFMQQYSEVLEADGGPLSLRDMKVPNGLRLHVLDIWLDELQKVDEQRQAPLQRIMAPISKLKTGSLVKSVRERAKESIEDDRLLDGKAWRPEDHEEEEPDVGFGGFDD
ncbi:Ribosomal RNA-processing protein 1-like [Pseudocercospora fuligena]|uniref:Ribosomal RNA-processing protein 1-like n=1 Tax=Pseudocercospora fuligena TaxID=685502 RepID=A0A8H6RN89_9PEZI|nr:Ribosomal RNA-processing protein 1-like [Pseudocercospora fuligena]